MTLPESITVKIFDVSLSSSNSFSTSFWVDVRDEDETLQILMAQSWEQLARRRSPESVGQSVSIKNPPRLYSTSQHTVHVDCWYTSKTFLTIFGKL